VSVNGTGGQCTAVPELGQNWDLTISDDGRNLYAPGQGGNLVVFSINQSTGSLTKIQCLGPGAGCTALRGDGNLFATAVHGSSLYLRVTNGLLVFTRDGNGRLEQKAGAAGCFGEPAAAGCTPAFGLGSQGFQISVTPDGGAVYVSNQTPGGISIFQRLSDGSLLQTNGTAGGCITTDGSSNNVDGRCVSSGNSALANSWASLPDPQSNYVYVSGISGMTVFSRNKTTQLLTQVECYVEGADANGCKGRLGVSGMHTAMIPGANEMVSSAPFAGVVGFLLRNPSTGKLTQRPGSGGCFSSSGNGGACQVVGPISGFWFGGVAASSNGLNVYAGFSGTGLVADFQRDFRPSCQNTTISVPYQTSILVPLTCSDANGDPLTLAVTSQPLNGSLGGGGAIDGATKTVRYNPPLGFTGPDSFTYTAKGRGVTSPAARVTLNVAAPLAPPAAPAPPAPPALAPASQPTPAPGKILVTVGFAFSSSSNKQTKFTSLTVKGFPSGSTVTVSCIRGTCPSSLVAKKKKGNKTKRVSKPLVFRNARGTVRLSKVISKALKARTRIRVDVTKAGMIGAVKIVEVRKRKAPKVTTQCLPVGSTKPQRTC
jgi:hypothetical protein